MKRRRFMQTLVAAPAAPALIAQQQAPASALPPAAPQASDAALDLSVPDAAAETVPRFFSDQQLATLRKLSNLLMPSLNGTPGALDACAAEFLDFLIGSSPTERQRLYREGLDALHSQSKKRFGKPFAEIEGSQADELLAPLRQPWTYELPADALARLLWTAKEDVRTATMNSREWSLAAAANGRGSRSGLYWLPID